MSLKEHVWQVCERFRGCGLQHKGVLSGLRVGEGKKLASSDKEIGERWPNFLNLL